jgi:hypothetical protein
MASPGGVNRHAMGADRRTRKRPRVLSPDSRHVKLLAPKIA